MLKELEKLLREVAEQQGNQNRPGRRIPNDLEVIDNLEVIETADVEIVEAEPVHRGVAAGVASNIDTSDITQHAANLGATVGQADDKLESRLHEKFDHDLSRIHDGSPTDIGDGQQSAEARSAASEIAQMLRDPQSIRQAVILQEILTRPADSW